MTDTYRAMCAELVDALENARRIIDGADGTLHINTAEFVLTRARALLAQPEPEEEDCPGCEGTPVASNSPCAVCGRAVLARWGNSQAILDSSPTTPIN